MADKRIVNLFPLTQLEPTDLLLVVDDPGNNPVNKKITISDFFNGYGANDTATQTISKLRTLRTIDATSDIDLQRHSQILQPKSLISQGSSALEAGGVYTGTDSTRLYIKITGAVGNVDAPGGLDNSGNPTDLFAWSWDNITYSSNISILSYTYQNTSNGVTVKFGQNIGHAVGDLWVIDIRRPGRVNFTGDILLEDGYRGTGNISTEGDLLLESGLDVGLEDEFYISANDSYLILHGNVVIGEGATDLTITSNTFNMLQNAINVTTASMVISGTTLTVNTTNFNVETPNTIILGSPAIIGGSTESDEWHANVEAYGTYYVGDENDTDRFITDHTDQTITLEEAGQLHLVSDETVTIKTPLVDIRTSNTFLLGNQDTSIKLFGNQTSFNKNVFNISSESFEVNVPTIKITTPVFEHVGNTLNFTSVGALTVGGVDTTITGNTTMVTGDHHIELNSQAANNFLHMYGYEQLQFDDDGDGEVGGILLEDSDIFSDVINYILVENSDLISVSSNNDIIINGHLTTAIRGGALTLGEFEGEAHTMSLLIQSEVIDIGVSASTPSTITFGSNTSSLGFFGTTPVTQNTNMAAASTVAQLRDELIRLGLIS